MPSDGPIFSTKSKEMPRGNKTLRKKSLLLARLFQPSKVEKLQRATKRCARNRCPLCKPMLSGELDSTRQRQRLLVYKGKSTKQKTSPRAAPNGRSHQPTLTRHSQPERRPKSGRRNMAKTASSRHPVNPPSLLTQPRLKRKSEGELRPNTLPFSRPPNRRLPLRTATSLTGGGPLSNGGFQPS